MHHTMILQFVGILLSASMLVLSGCAGGPLKNSFVAGWLPERGDDPADLERYGPIKSQHIEHLRSLADQVGDADPEVRDRISKDLVQRVRNELDPTVRVEVVKALGEFPNPSAAEGLRWALMDNAPEVRIAACQAWHRRGGTDAAVALAGVMGSETDLDVRLAAARALSGFRHPAALQALGSALDDSNPAIKYRAIESLRASSEFNYGENLGAWRQFAQGGNPPRPDTRFLAGKFRRLF